MQMNMNYCQNRMWRSLPMNRINTYVWTCDDLINKSSAVLLAMHFLNMLPDAHESGHIHTQHWKGTIKARRRLTCEDGKKQNSDLSLTLERLTSMYDAMCTDVDPELPRACRLCANMQNRGGNRETGREECHKHRGEFTYHTRAERRELSAALHEQETEEKQPPRHPQ